MPTPPTLILLPGLQGNDSLFAPLRALIPPEIKTRTINYPTHKKSTYADLLTQLESDLASEFNLILLAESFSGPLAIRFAAAHPTRIKALILVATFITNPVPYIIGLLAHPLILRIPLSNLAIRALFGSPRTPLPTLRALRHSIHAIDPRVLSHRIRQITAINATAALKKCTCPILYLRGTRDLIVLPDSLWKIRRHAQNLTTKKIPAPHLLLQQNPTAAWRAIHSFLTPLIATAPTATSQV